MRVIMATNRQDERITNVKRNIDTKVLQSLKQAKIPPDITPLDDLPRELLYVQTTSQVFYIFNLNLIFQLLKLKLTNNHYLIAECNDVLVGVQHISKLNRKSQTTLAVMGRDSISGSEQYCDMSQIPDISILDNLTNKKYPLSMYNIQPFYSNEIYIM